MRRQVSVERVADKNVVRRRKNFVQSKLFAQQLIALGAEAACRHSILNIVCGSFRDGYLRQGIVIKPVRLS
jgi:hypothetical protein